MIKRNQFESLLANASRRSFLLRTGAATIGAAMPPWASAAQGDPAMVERWTDGCGLVHDRISPYWAKQCELLPCFRGVAWPGYAEEIICDVSLPGTQHKVIVHLWKGICQKFGNSSDFPGGFGAEVGVYLHRDAGWIAGRVAETQLHPESLWFGNAGALMIAQGARLDPSKKWYPAPELKPRLKFRLLDPHNNNAQIFETKEIESYWCTEWLEESSYKKWAGVRPQMRATRKIIHPVELTLQYWINGVEQPLWAFKNGDQSCTANVGCPNDPPCT